MGSWTEQFFKHIVKKKKQQPNNLLRNNLLPHVTFASQSVMLHTAGFLEVG